MHVDRPKWFFHAVLSLLAIFCFLMQHVHGLSPTKYLEVRLFGEDFSIEDNTADANDLLQEIIKWKADVLDILSDGENFFTPYMENKKIKDQNKNLTHPFGAAIPEIKTKLLDTLPDSATDLTSMRNQLSASSVELLQKFEKFLMKMAECVEHKGHEITAVKQYCDPETSICTVYADVFDEASLHCENECLSGHYKVDGNISWCHPCKGLGNEVKHDSCFCKDNYFRSKVDPFYCVQCYGATTGLDANDTCLCDSNSTLSGDECLCSAGYMPVGGKCKACSGELARQNHVGNGLNTCSDDCVDNHNMKLNKATSACECKDPNKEIDWNSLTCVCPTGTMLVGGTCKDCKTELFRMAGTSPNTCDPQCVDPKLELKSGAEACTCIAADTTIGNAPDFCQCNLANAVNTGSQCVCNDAFMLSKGVCKSCSTLGRHDGTGGACGGCKNSKQGIDADGVCGGCDVLQHLVDVSGQCVCEKGYVADANDRCVPCSALFREDGTAPNACGACVTGYGPASASSAMNEACIVLQVPPSYTTSNETLNNVNGSSVNGTDENADEDKIKEKEEKEEKKKADAQKCYTDNRLWVNSKCEGCMEGYVENADSELCELTNKSKECSKKSPHMIANTKDECVCKVGFQQGTGDHVEKCLFTEASCFAQGRSLDDTGQCLCAAPFKGKANENTDCTSAGVLSAIVSVSVTSFAALTMVLWTFA